MHAMDLGLTCIDGAGGLEAAYGKARLLEGASL